MTSIDYKMTVSWTANVKMVREKQDSLYSIIHNKHTILPPPRTPSLWQHEFKTVFNLLIPLFLFFSLTTLWKLMARTSSMPNSSRNKYALQETKTLKFQWESLIADLPEQAMKNGCADNISSLLKKKKRNIKCTFIPIIF